MQKRILLSQFFVASLISATVAFGQNFPLPPSVPPADPAAGPGSAGLLGSGHLGSGTRGSGFGGSGSRGLVLPDAEEIPAGTSSGNTLHFPSEGPNTGSTVAPDPFDPSSDFNNFSGERFMGDPACDVWSGQPALTESTGTWLRRGWWYTEIDAVVLNRQWKRDDMTLANDNASTRSLNLNRSDPGASGSVRLTLGRFLFRDQTNRDHTVEFTAFGGGEWSQADNLTSSGGGNTIFVPTGISDFNLGFDQASGMSVEYSNRFTSFELNYRVKERMRRDRMELSPQGEWIRRANEGLTKQFLVGVRYFDLADILDWRATGINSQGGEDGRYFIDTNNDMIGIHLGGTLLLERDRWNVEIGGKGGAFLNDAKANSDFTITNNAANSFSVGNRETTFSFVGELQLIGRYHIRPNVSLRAGWQMMYITSVALAPDQLTFSPDAGRFPYTGDPFYNGGIFGIETYW